MPRVSLCALLAAAALALAACGDSGGTASTPAPPPDATTQTTPPANGPRGGGSGRRPAIATVVKGLDVPWELAFLPDGSALLTERPGRVLHLDRNLRLAKQPVATIPVVAQEESGLLGLAIDPDFKRNRFVYLYRTTGSGNEVLRFRYQGGKLADKQVIVDALAASLIHDGGRLRFGPDGALYITTGEADQSQLSQDLGSLNGKLLRVADPRGGKVRPEIVSRGHRNVQGLDWQPGSGRLYATEFGPDSHDEVNLIEKGHNYGWPIVQGKAAGNGFTPAVVDYTQVIAPSGATFVHRKGSRWTGDYLIACLRGEQLRRVVFEGDRVVKDQALYQGRFGRLREVVEGPDGLIYLLTNNTDGRGSPRPGDDRIVRVVPPGR